MPQVKKTITKKTSASRSKDNPTEELMEFEKFVSRKPQTVSRAKGWLFATFFVVIVVLVAALFYTSQDENLVLEYKFKAVALDNGQVYYAKVVKEDALSVYLDEVYYIQFEDRIIPAQEEDGEDTVEKFPVLVKHGEELHRPEGWLQINRTKVVAIEDVGADSEILTEIERLKTLQ